MKISFVISDSQVIVRVLKDNQIVEMPLVINIEIANGVVVNEKEVKRKMDLIKSIFIDSPFQFPLSEAEFEELKNKINSSS